MITVRARNADDLAAIVEIMDCPGVIYGTLQYPYISRDQRQEMLQRRPGDHPLVAEVDGRVVGQLGLQVLQRPRMRHIGSIGMAVHDDFQGRGVGKALLAAAVDLADQWLDLHRLELTVYVDNPAAIHLYETFGFAQEGRLRDYAFRAGAYVDAYTMGRLRR